MLSTISLTVSEARVADYVGCGLILVILFARIAANVFQFRRLDTPIYLVIAAIILVSARVAVNHYILLYGTVNDYRKKYGPGSDVQPQLHHAKVASMLSLAARVLITTFYWIQCILLLLLYRKLVQHINWVRHTINLCWAIIATTYLAVVLTTFLECQPFRLYNELTPTTPTCVKAYGQLLTQCLSNIVIDCFLLVISFPILKAQVKIFPRNIQLGILYTLGTFCIIVTLIRIASTYQQNSTQYVRSFWASMQAVTAAFVANTPPIYAAVVVWWRRRFGGADQTDKSWVATSNVPDEQSGDTWIKGNETIVLRSRLAQEDKDRGVERSPANAPRIAFWPQTA